MATPAKRRLPLRLDVFCCAAGFLSLFLFSFFFSFPAGSVLGYRSVALGLPVGSVRVRSTSLPCLQTSLVPSTPDLVLLVLAVGVEVRLNFHSRERRVFPPESRPVGRTSARTFWSLGLFGGKESASLLSVRLESRQVLGSVAETSGMAESHAHEEEL